MSLSHFCVSATVGPYTHTPAFAEHLAEQRVGERITQEIARKGSEKNSQENGEVFGSYAVAVERTLTEHFTERLVIVGKLICVAERAIQLPRGYFTVEKLEGVVQFSTIGTLGPVFLGATKLLIKEFAGC